MVQHGVVDDGLVLQDVVLPAQQQGRTEELTHLLGTASGAKLCMMVLMPSAAGFEV